MKRHIHTIMLLLLVACLTCGNVVHASADIFDTDLVEQYEVAPYHQVRQSKLWKVQEK